MPDLNRQTNQVISNIGTYVTRKEAGLVILADQFGRGHMTEYAKRKAKWIDRTSRARNGLHGGGFRAQNSIISFVAHGVDYGVYLEKIQNGKYAILNQTIQTNTKEFKRLVGRFLSQ